MLHPIELGYVSGAVTHILKKKSGLNKIEVISLLCKVQANEVAVLCQVVRGPDSFFILLLCHAQSIVLIHRDWLGSPHIRIPARGKEERGKGDPICSQPTDQNLSTRP